MASPDSAAARKQIVEVIGNCVYHALGLKETLEDERHALETQDVGALQAAIESKSRCVDELRAMDEQRQVLCAEAGFAAGPDQMLQMVEWCDESSVVANCWQHLMDIATECNTLNVTNGAIIQGRRQQLDSGIALLRGGQTETDTYNRSGRGPRGPNLRSLAQA